jgi:hypothetical protein
VGTCENHRNRIGSQQPTSKDHKKHARFSLGIKRREVGFTVDDTNHVHQETLLLRLETNNMTNLYDVIQRTRTLKPAMVVPYCL